MLLKSVQLYLLYCIYVYDEVYTEKGTHSQQFLMAVCL